MKIAGVIEKAQRKKARKRTRENTACTYRQTYIPDLFFDEAFPLFIERQKANKP